MALLHGHEMRNFGYILSIKIHATKL